jgi:hypothetical protein
LIYLDSSALVKLATTEPETAALNDWLAGRPNLVRVASSIISVEMPRAVWRADPGSLPQAYTLARRMRQIRMTEAVLRRAAGVRPATLRSLDAIHLGSALAIKRELTVFVSYDTRLLEAAREAGLPTASPS